MYVPMWLTVFANQVITKLEFLQTRALPPMGYPEHGGPPLLTFLWLQREVAWKDRWLGKAVSKFKGPVLLMLS